MVEFFRHILGICGEHFHPNIWTTMASLPIIATTVHYIKCKCEVLSSTKTAEKFFSF